MQDTVALETTSSAAHLHISSRLAAGLLAFAFACFRIHVLWLQHVMTAHQFTLTDTNCNAPVN